MTKDDRSLAGSDNREIGLRDILAFNPISVFSFVVYDHEETALFGIMRDAMCEKGQAEEAKAWNQRRAKAMMSILFEKTSKAFGNNPQMEEILIFSKSMAEAGVAAPLDVKLDGRLLTAGPVTSPRRYGCWAGNPKGKAEDPERCTEESQDKVSRLFHQCYRKRGFGQGGLYCRQHAKWHPVDKGFCDREVKR
jgi:hypothetical protein